MELKSSIAELRITLKASTQFLCERCGAETAAIGGMCMCSNCESIATNTRSTLERKDHMLLGSLDRINKAIAASDYNSAISVYDELVSQRKDPSLMYAEALLYLKYSNYEVMQIGYENPGFMEGNTAHRDKASKLASLAKKLLAKSVSQSKREIMASPGSLGLTYNLFLSQMKLGMMRAANSTINDILKLDSRYVYNYAKMVFEARREHYDDMVKAADTLTSAENFSLNAFYYMGLWLFKKGRYKEAKEMLNSLNGLMRSSNLEALLFEIDAQLATWR